MNPIQILLAAMGLTLGNLNAFRFFTETKETVLESSSKTSVAIGTIALYSVVKEKFNKLSNEQIEELLTITFGGNSKQLIKFIVKNNIEIACECDDCKNEQEQDIKTDSELPFDIKDVLPREVVEAMERGEVEVEVHAINLADLFKK